MTATKSKTFKNDCIKYNLHGELKKRKKSSKKKFFYLKNYK